MNNQCRKPSQFSQILAFNSILQPYYKRKNYFSLKQLLKSISKQL